MWLKKRIDFATGPGRMDFGALFVELHVFPIHWLPVEIPNNEQPSEPHWARTQLISLIDADPVNQTARRLIKDDSQACPWCNQWFRNPWALAYHAQERHGQKIERRQSA